MSRRHAWGARLLALVVAFSLSACTGVPSEGTRTVRALPQDPSDAFVHTRTPGPEAGLPPRGVVNRFLSASSEFDDRLRTAGDFLTDTARRTWAGSSGKVPRVLVFDTLTPLNASSGLEDREQIFEGNLVADVRPDGRYVPLSGRVELIFTLQNTAAGTEAQSWRISNLDVGKSPGLPIDLGTAVFLTRAQVAQAMAAVWLWWPSLSLTTLVPEPVLLARGVGDLAGLLVSRLAGGPGPELRGAVLPTAPVGVDLSVASASAGVVAINSGGTESLPDAEGRGLRASLNRTLRQPGLGVDQVVLDGRSLAGSDDLYDADTRGAVDSVAAVDSKGRAILLPFLPLAKGVAPRPVAELARFRVRHPVRQLAGHGVPDRWAALSEDRRRLIVAQGQETARTLLAVPQGSELTAPSFDDTGAVWTADAITGQVYVAETATGLAKAVTLPTSGLPAGSVITRVEPSPDGARVALVPHVKGEADTVVVAAVHVTQTPGGGNVTLGPAQPLAAAALPYDKASLKENRVVTDIDWSDFLSVSLLLGRAVASSTPNWQRMGLGQIAVATTPTPLSGADQIAVPPLELTKQPVIYQKQVGKVPGLFLQSSGKLLRAGVHDPSYG